MKRWHIRNISAETVHRVRAIQEETDAHLAEIVGLCVYFGADRAREYLRNQTEPSDDLLSLIAEMRQGLHEIEGIIHRTGSLAALQWPPDPATQSNLADREVPSDRSDSTPQTIS